MLTSTQESGIKRLQIGRIRSQLSILCVQPKFVVGAIILGVFLLLSFAGTVIAPYDPTAFHLDAAFQQPSRVFLFGTDNFGRDVFSRVIVGSRSILTVAGTVTVLSILLGTLLGGIPAYYGGLQDEVIMRIIDGMMAVPPLLMALLIISTLGSGTVNLIIAITILYSPVVARLVRSAVLEERVKEYVAAAEVRGESSFYILFREILPNIWSSLIVEASIRFCYSIILVAGLGFLGLGISPPTPDWGLMVSEGRRIILLAPWVVIAPTAAISVLIVGVNMLADGFQEFLGDRSKIFHT